MLVGELGWATARVLEAQEERAASAERASASKNIFLRNMSHEIRTPIAAMLGFADLLASTDPEHQDRPDLLRRLQANGLAVMSLLDDLLDLARLDANKIVLTPEPVSVIDLVREVLASLEIDARRRVCRCGSTRRARRSAHLGPTVIACARSWSTSWRTPSSSPRPAASRSRLRATHALDDGHWTIDITDTGIGITADQRMHLFEPFEQANASIARAYGGNGLGLALSRKLAEQLGGALVLLRSAPGEGTTFRLTLTPLKTEPRESPSGPRAVGSVGPCMQRSTFQKCHRRRAHSAGRRPSRPAPCPA